MSKKNTIVLLLKVDALYTIAAAACVGGRSRVHLFQLFRPEMPEGTKLNYHAYVRTSHHYNFTSP